MCMNASEAHIMSVRVGEGGFAETSYSLGSLQLRI